MIKHWKLFSLALIVILGVLLFINYSFGSSSTLSSYNKLQEQFHDEYLTLQEERVRVAAIAHNGAGHDEIIDQLEIMHKQADKTYKKMVEMYETASEINLSEDEQTMLFTQPVYAGKLQDLGKNVIWNLPLVGRLAHGFDTTTDSIRLGLYKAYDSGITGDQEIIEELMLERGIKTREELLTAPPEDITWVFSHARSTEASPTINNEVNLAEVAVKGGVAAVKAYFDGILLATGGKTINMQSELLKQLGVSSDIQSFIKMGLGDVTAEGYLKNKAKEEFLKVYEYVLTPDEIKSIMNEDSDEIKKILARAKSMEDEEQKETVKTILALSQVGLNLGMQVADNNDIDEDTPYHEWPPEAQRELAQKLNTEEENGPIMISAKAKSGSVTQYLLPSGMWDILMSSRGTVPRYMYNVEKESGKTGSMISLATRLSNAKLAQDLIEQESVTYEKLNEMGLLTPEDIKAYNSQKEKEDGISKLLQPLRNLLRYQPWETSNNNTPCTQNWQCGDWEACSDGMQIRQCWDENACGSLENNDRPIKTIESQDCEDSSNSTGCSGDGSLLNQVCRGDRPQQSGGDSMPRVDTSLLDE